MSDIDREWLAEALFDTQHERLYGGADGFGLGSHDADAGAIIAAYDAIAERARKRVFGELPRVEPPTGRMAELYDETWETRHD